MSDRYAHGWRNAWLGWAGVTLCVATVLWSFSGVLTLLVTLTLLVGLLTVLVRSGADQGAATLPPGRVLVDGASGGLVAAAVVVTGMVQVGLGFLVLTAVGLTSPHVIRLFLGAGRGSDRESGGDVSDTLHPLDLHAAREAVDRLDLAGLCWAWSHSAELLAEVPATQARAAVVALRGIYLDEMERRDPDGFRAWIDSGAGAMSSPDRFLRPPDEDERDVA
jgi:hypothetical protein